MALGELLEPAYPGRCRARDAASRTFWARPGSIKARDERASDAPEKRGLPQLNRVARLM